MFSARYLDKYETAYVEVAQLRRGCFNFWDSKMSSTEGIGDGRPDDATEHQKEAIRLHVLKILRKLRDRKRDSSSS